MGNTVSRFVSSQAKFSTVTKYSYLFQNTLVPFRNHKKTKIFRGDGHSCCYPQHAHVPNELFQTVYDTELLFFTSADTLVGENPSYCKLSIVTIIRWMKFKFKSVNSALLVIILICRISYLGFVQPFLVDACFSLQTCRIET